MSDATDYDRAFDPDAEPFLRVVTEALRAGPGSPEWREVVTTLRGGGVGGVIDYELLMRVRQDLESGRAFRAVRAGPGFTRKLMTRLDDEPSAAKGPRVLTPSVLASVAGIALVLLVVGLALHVLRPAPPAASPAAERLAGTTFGTTAQSAAFTIAGGGDAPAGWRTFGTVRVDPPSGLQPTGDAGARGGVMTGLLPADGPIAVEAVARGRTGGGVVVQVFVADGAPDAVDAAAAEMAAVLRDDVVRPVLPDGRFVGDAAPAVGVVPQWVVRVAVDGDVAVVTANGRRLYAGPSGLPVGRPRYVGVRFLSTDGPAGGDLAVQAVRVLKP